MAGKQRQRPWLVRHPRPPDLRPTPTHPPPLLMYTHRAPTPPRADNWAIHNHSFHRAWLERHIEESASVLRKPILLEEFGKVLGR